MLHPSMGQEPPLKQEQGTEEISSRVDRREEQPLIDYPSPNLHRRENARDDPVRGTAMSKQQGYDDDDA